ncbi:amidase [Falsiroseomonas sp. CW058]|uniref:amidase n=1 Tax=Falsiroseomonas sp. CW058 TaxID=3388664 RepID=UPI003D311B70
MPRVIEDRVGAFVPGPRVDIPGAAEGPLAGIDFAVKDLFDVAGATTGYGNPDWARTHAPAAATAPVVLALLQAGARLRGKTKTVELAYGLTGENVWYGTPTNPAAPDRFPGGSSCGSAAAVAAGLVDVALGSDTGGSVRIPASYCGIFGIRPSWGAVNLTGACPLGPSFDTCGWFAPTASLLRRVGEVLLPHGGEGALGPLLKVQEAWVNAVPQTAAALVPALAGAEKVLGPALAVHVAPEGLDELFEHFRHAQAEEAWASLGSWIEAMRPALGPGVQERFAAAKATDPARAAAARRFREVFRGRIRALLAGGAVLAYPTSPVPAPKLDIGLEVQQAVRERSMGVTAISGLAGLCEVTLPAARVDGAPVGLSLAAAPGRDRALLALAERVATALKLPA